MKLYCLPYAGCSARVYDSWRGLLPESVDVVPLELPGRGSRCVEEPLADLSALLEDLIGLTSAARTVPYAVFGHSYGALVAFELAKLMRARGYPAPAALIVSASRAPHLLPKDEAVHTLSDAEFKERLAALRGTPRELLENDELMELFIPIIRADYQILHAYEATIEARVDCPITALCGSTDDDAVLTSVEPWRQYTTKSFDVAHIDGDHFFLHSREKEVVARVADVLKR
ncbi:thioesterase II family protein [Streptomyces chromofuscus]|uniref:thioesterase II family protein n=1 Tax=Streptomyces chromofuscus TaxID=42881 RepID=UPI00167282D9|nr:alpha/beta fold hydrolase [Streptomyces chromofuscus]GGT43266.1 thioesterase [Streptomyces chromofuscus]